MVNRPKTKILVDGGDPEETQRIKELIGSVDGQTTNPSLIAKNPEVQELIASGHKLTTEEQKDEYKKIVRKLSLLIGDAGVSRSKSSLTWIQLPNRCSHKAVKCLPGFRTLTSSTHARMKVCGLRMYQYKSVFAST